MTTLRTIARSVIIGLSMASFLASPASAMGELAPGEPAVMTASTDCYAIGMQQAAQVGGQLARATPETRGGQRVCVIVVLMPAKDGQRPRRSEFIVPLG